MRTQTETLQRTSYYFYVWYMRIMWLSIGSFVHKMIPSTLRHLRSEPNFLPNQGHTFYWQALKTAGQRPAAVNPTLMIIDLQELYKWEAHLRSTKYSAGSRWRRHTRSATMPQVDTNIFHVTPSGMIGRNNSSKRAFGARFKKIENTINIWEGHLNYGLSK